jgi:hypothetical protein
MAKSYRRTLHEGLYSHDLVTYIDKTELLMYTFRAANRSAIVLRM